MKKTDCPKSHSIITFNNENEDDNIDNYQYDDTYNENMNTVLRNVLLVKQVMTTTLVMMKLITMGIITTAMTMNHESKINMFPIIFSWIRKTTSSSSL